jgi:acyl-[acyl carrier protein]--UDP-N-acetylglucosamine O-acyltransferase
MFLPGGQHLRVFLHRLRGVNIGKNVWISLNVILETESPNLITIDDSAFIGIGVIVIAHFRESRHGVRIGKQAFIGPGAIILPNVEIGDGAVVTAGSVVSKSVPAMTVVQGNPAIPVAKCGVPLEPGTSLMKFSMRLKSLSSVGPSPTGAPEKRADPKPERSECEARCPLRRCAAASGCTASPSCPVPGHFL